MSGAFRIFLPRVPAACLLLALCANAHAFTEEEMMAGADRLYRKHLAEQEAHYVLDPDPAFLARVRRIADVLIALAKREHPETAAWTWEVHTTADESENAFCMAGGRLLVGQPYVTRLGLDDDELAMLLAHEIEHALLQHNRQEFEEALRLEPRYRDRPFAELEDAVDNDAELIRRLGGLYERQEIEADREGLKFA